MVPQTSNDRKVFALLIAEKLLEHAYPGEEKRIARAAKIVLHQQVELHTDGTATVESQCQTGFAYTINGACNCLDRAAPAGRCKHRLAVALQKKVECLMAQQVRAEDARDGVQGIATPVMLPGSEFSVYVFQPDKCPAPHYVPAWALVLGPTCESIA